MKNTTDKTILVPLISDGPNTGFKSVPNPDYIGPQPSLSPSYTLTELKRLAHQWSNDPAIEADDYDKLAVSVFVAWLAKAEKEREANGATD